MMTKFERDLATVTGVDDKQQKELRDLMKKLQDFQLQEVIINKLKQQADDVLEDIELKTGKRLDASLPFVIGIFTMISGTIASTLAPLVLYDDPAKGWSSIIHYIPAAETQTLDVKIKLLFFYTIFHGLMMFLAGVPFFFYKLTGKTKDEMHEKVLARRALEEQQKEA